MENYRTGADLLDWFREGAARIKKGSGGIADRIPVYAQMSHHSAKLAGESTTEFFTNAEVFLRCELAADVFYEIDAPTIHYDVYNIEAEAMGAKLIWNENQIPAIDSCNPLLGSLDALRHLRPIRTGVAGRMPYVMEINARLMDAGFAPKVRFTGLFTLAANLLGLQQLIMAILIEPDRVHRLMKFLTYEIVAPWIVCQRKHCGSHETATGSDALASPPLISTEMVREFCLKYIKELEQQVGGVRLAGLWGESVLSEPAELLDIKKAGSPGAIQVLDPDVTSLGPAFFRKYADESRVGLVMGLDANLIRSGSLAEIESRARRFIEEAGKAGRFVLFINDIPYDTPPENVRAVISVAHEYRADSSNTCYVRKQRDTTGQPAKTIKEACRLVSDMMEHARGRRK
jgi:uroporphyrinogen-III decarboxylase